MRSGVEAIKTMMQGLENEIKATDAKIKAINAGAKDEKSEKLKWEMERLALEEIKQFKEFQKQELESLIKSKDVNGRGMGPKVTPKRAPVKYMGAATRPRLGPQDESDTALRILTALHQVCSPNYLPPTDLKWETERNAALIDQAEDKIKALERLLEKADEFRGWFCVGRKKDVPHCACFVGHYHRCNCDCYVWVTQENAGKLREFTQLIMALVPIERQDVLSGRGAAFSPSIR